MPNIIHSKDIYHFETSNENVCDGIIALNDNIIINCKHFDYDQKRITHPSCTFKSMQWRHNGHLLVTNSSRNDIYAVVRREFNEIPVYTAYTLPNKINNIRLQDLGQYECVTECLDHDGNTHEAHSDINLCIKTDDNDSIMCLSKLPHNVCAQSFWNGICKLDCIDERNHFSGFECEAQISQCDSKHINSCYLNHGNGVCNPECNNLECGYDGIDCIEKPVKWIHGSLVLFLNHPNTYPQDINLNKVEVNLTRLLRTIVKISSIDGKKLRKNIRNEILNNTIYMHRGKELNIELKILKDMKKKQAFKKMEKVSEFLMLAIENNWNPGFSINKVAVKKNLKKRCKTKISTDDFSIILNEHKMMTKEKVLNFSHNSRSSINVANLIYTAIGCVSLILLVLFISISINKLHGKSIFKNHKFLNGHKYKLHSSNI